MWFDVIMQYDNIGVFLALLSLINMVLSVVTTNDSASIVLNTIASNGEYDQAKSTVEKMLWSLLMGGISIIMLVVGKARALTALQTTIIALGLPNTLQTCLICYSVKIALDMELHPDTDVGKSVSQGRHHALSLQDNGLEFWANSLFRVLKLVDYLAAVCTGQAQSGLVDLPPIHDIVVHWLKMSVFPWYWLGVCDFMCAKNIHDPSQVQIFRMDFADRHLVKCQALTAASCFFFHLALALVVAAAWIKNVWVIGLICYFIFALMIAYTRASVIHRYNIGGDVVRDCIAAIFLYAWTLEQMYSQLELPFPQSEVHSVARRHSAYSIGTTSSTEHGHVTTRASAEFLKSSKADSASTTEDTASSATESLAQDLNKDKRLVPSALLPHPTHPTKMLSRANVAVANEGLDKHESSACICPGGFRAKGLNEIRQVEPLDQAGSSSPR